MFASIRNVNPMWREFGDLQNLPKDRRSWGRFCRSPNSLHMGFTFLMDANTSKYFYNYSMGMNQTLISHWKMKKSLELRDQFYIFLILKNIYVYFYFISILASIRNGLSYMKIPLCYWVLLTLLAWFRARLPR